MRGSRAWFFFQAASPAQGSHSVSRDIQAMQVDVASVRLRVPVHPRTDAAMATIHFFKSSMTGGRGVVLTMAHPLLLGPKRKRFSPRFVAAVAAGPAASHYCCFPLGMLW